MSSRQRWSQPTRLLQLVVMWLTLTLQLARLELASANCQILHNADFQAKVSLALRASDKIYKTRWNDFYKGFKLLHLGRVHMSNPLEEIKKNPYCEHLVSLMPTAEHSPIVGTTAVWEGKFEGKDTIMVAVRGSTSTYDWCFDFDARYTTLPNVGGVTGIHGHKGFDEIANRIIEIHHLDPKTHRVRPAKFEDLIVEWVKKHPHGLVIFTGHSLGGGVCQHLALRVIRKVPQLKPYIITFASPRPGNAQFAAAIKKLTIHYRIAGLKDAVPASPPFDDKQAAEGVGKAVDVVGALARVALFIPKLQDVAVPVAIVQRDAKKYLQAMGKNYRHGAAVHVTIGGGAPVNCFTEDHGDTPEQFIQKASLLSEEHPIGTYENNIATTFKYFPIGGHGEGPGHGHGPKPRGRQPTTPMHHGKGAGAGASSHRPNQRPPGARRRLF